MAGPSVNLNHGADDFLKNCPELFVYSLNESKLGMCINSEG